MPEGNNHLISAATNDSWRTWLVTGARRGPVDRRRLRGAHRGLKQMLIEGAGDPTRPHSWKEFSDAMVRHAVDEAMRALPIEETAMVKLAFFGGYSNREIATVMRLTEATVQRRLRDALNKISDYVHRGRVMGRRALYALLVWVSARSLSDAMHQAMETAVVATAAAIIIVHPAPSITSAAGTPPAAGVHHSTPSSAVSQPTVVPPLPSPTVPAPAMQGSQPAPTQSLQLPSLPSLPAVPTVTVPPLPNPPPLPKI